jgi:hypothetical protein
VSGSIPPSCTAPFTSLIHLGVSNTSVGGALPACIVNSVHQLEISHAMFTGAFPKIEAGANLRYLLAETDPEALYKFTGPFPSLEFAEHLHYANLNNHQVRLACPSFFARGLALLVHMWHAAASIVCHVLICASVNRMTTRPHVVCSVPQSCSTEKVYAALYDPSAGSS